MLSDGSLEDVSDVVEEVFSVDFSADFSAVFPVLFSGAFPVGFSVVFLVFASEGLVGSVEDGAATTTCENAPASVESAVAAAVALASGAVADRVITAARLAASPRYAR
ncbi:hypothetical protein [Corynebacterium sp. HMSC073H12]|uniref:hypothetical protein n=1 Tax=Corynebacterium sp. HMSC073H12 TaxID=1715187 RepID=UPI001FEEB0A2|nr:hypothetical protein [Corynebacterium sp. HMSC073H12]